MAKRSLIDYAAKSLFLILISLFSFAQFSPPTTINTPFGKRTIPGTMKFTNYSNAYQRGFVNKKHTFTIVLLNDSTFQVRAEINIQDSVNFITWGKGEKKQTVFPSETKEIYRTNVTGKISGIPKDSCWIFPVRKDKISAYSISSDIENSNDNYIQKGDSGIVLLDHTTLEEWPETTQKLLNK